VGAGSGVNHPASCTCATCDPLGGQPPAVARSRISAVKVRARDEDFRIVAVKVRARDCSRANGNCCCGWGEKGRCRTARLDPTHSGPTSPL
jgi:hypothetical protein